MQNSSSELTAKQETLQASVDGVNARLDKMSEMLSKAVIVENEGDTSSDEDPVAVTIKLKRSDAETMKEEISKLSSTVKDLMNGIAEINESIVAKDAKRDADNHKLIMKNNDLDQQYRLNNAIFHNIQVPPINYDKDGKQIIQHNDSAKFCQFIADQLNFYLPELSIPVSLHSIDIAHPLRNNSKNQSIVIVRFVNRHLRNEILEKDNKNILKSHGIGVTEQLTPTNMELFNKTKVVVGAPNVWSRNGKIFARTANGKIHVTLNTVVNDLTPPPPREENSINTGTGDHPSTANKSKKPTERRQRPPKDTQTRGWGNVQTPQTFYYGSQPPFAGGDARMNQAPYGRGWGHRGY